MNIDQIQLFEVAWLLTHSIILLDDTSGRSGGDHTYFAPSKSGFANADWSNDK